MQWTLIVRPSGNDWGSSHQAEEVVLGKSEQGLWAMKERTFVSLAPEELKESNGFCKKRSLMNSVCAS